MYQWPSMVFTINDYTKTSSAAIYRDQIPWYIESKYRYIVAIPTQTLVPPSASPCLWYLRCCPFISDTRAPFKLPDLALHFTVRTVHAEPEFSAIHERIKYPKRFTSARRRDIYLWSDCSRWVPRQCSGNSFVLENVGRLYTCSPVLVVPAVHSFFFFFLNWREKDICCVLQNWLLTIFNWYVTSYRSFLNPQYLLHIAYWFRR